MVKALDPSSRCLGILAALIKVEAPESFNSTLSVLIRLSGFIFYILITVRERGSERERETERGRDRGRERERERERKRERERERERGCSASLTNCKEKRRGLEKSQDSVDQRNTSSKPVSIYN